jgi:hypothetical protein
MSGKMVPITAYTNSVEAGMIKSRLESAGITAFLEGEESGNVFGIVNLQGVRVLIHEDDIERAERILDQWETEEADDFREPRRKKRRKPRESSDAIRAPTQSPLQAPSPIRTEPPPDAPAVEKAEPKAEVEREPHEEDQPADHEEEERVSRSLVWTPDDFARYAFRGAVLGLFCPVVATLISLYMLVRLATLQGELSQRGRLMAWVALALNAVMCVIASQVIRHRLWPE